jgi:hypothetical protein
MIQLSLSHFFFLFLKNLCASVPPWLNHNHKATPAFKLFLTGARNGIRVSAPSGFNSC